MIINQTLKCFHPKISFLIHKYKEYIINVYNKVTSSFVNKIETKEEIFSIIEDIKIFFINYKNAYKTKIEFNNILQGNEDTNNTILKACDYLLDILYDNNQNDFIDSNDEDDLLFENNLNYDNENILNNFYQNDKFNDDSEKSELNEIYP